MAKKRSNGEGSVYRRKDGSWVGQYKVLTSNGAKRRYIYAKTRKDAATRLAQAVAERDSGLVYDCGSMTVEDYLSKWLVTTKGTVRERTWIRSEVDVRVHLVPVLGKLRLDRLNALQIQALYRAKLDSGLSPRTVQIIHATLHKALKQASVMPLLQFLAYYQVIEYYFPVYTEIEAQKTLRNILKDPSFNPMRDAHIARLFDAIKFNAKGHTMGNESEQLETAIRHCGTAEDLRDFFPRIRSVTIFIRPTTQRSLSKQRSRSGKDQTIIGWPLRKGYTRSETGSCIPRATTRIKSRSFPSTQKPNT